MGILQARCSSSRLPGKVLKPILGEAMLARQIERLGRAKRIERLVVATSTDASDNTLEELCSTIGVPCYRGALDDVLDRFYEAAACYMPAHVIRLTGDCPLCDPELIDHLTARHLEGGFDYSSNALEPTFPDGLDAEIMTFDALRRAWREAELPSDREHVTPFIHQRPQRFRLFNLTNERDLAHLRWTVDEPEDFEMVSRVYEALYPENPGFDTAEILAFLDRHPEIAALNAARVRNEGLDKSRQQDQIFLAAKEKGRPA
ncbi:MAG: cytidylyltransferase domain-containing protein [Sphingomonadales bacterium]